SSSPPRTPGRRTAAFRNVSCRKGAAARRGWPGSTGSAPGPGASGWPPGRPSAGGRAGGSTRSPSLLIGSRSPIRGGQVLSYVPRGDAVVLQVEGEQVAVPKRLDLGGLQPLQARVGPGGHGVNGAALDRAGVEQAAAEGRGREQVRRAQAASRCSM